jgi:hypothetical protein
MKTNLYSILLLAAALSASALVPLSAASNKEPAIGFPVTTVKVNQSRDEIKRGTPLMTVLRLMGTQHQELTPDVWICHGFHADNLEMANEQGCDILVITFAQGKVADLKLVNKRAAVVIAANLKFKSAEAYASEN